MGILSRALRRTLLRLESAGPLTDGQLLGRFAKQHDHAAFEELVRRHGPMVLRVCARVLRHAQDAEDAFQAVWIVLARKAGAIADPERLAGWLHGVAYRVALQAKQGASQARLHEKHADEACFPDLSQSNLANAAANDETRAALHEELCRLPQKYRLPVVLCYLEGKSTDEVAQQLAWPRGTVAIRLSRARDLLRNRLARRGLTLSEAALAALLAHETATAAIPAALAVQVSRAALCGAEGHVASAGVLPDRVVALAEATQQTLAPSKPRIAAAIVLGICVLGAGASVLIMRSGGPKAPKTNEAGVSQPPAPALAEAKPVYRHWDPLTRRFGATVHHPVEARWGEARSAAWSGDGKVLAVGFSTGAILLSVRTDENNPDAIRNLSALKAQTDQPVTKVAFSPDRKTLAALAGNEREGVLLLWDLSGPGPVPLASSQLNYRQVPTRWAHEAKLVFTPDGATLIQYLGLPEPIFWDVASATRKPLRLPQECVFMSVSPDGTTLGLYRETTKSFLAWDVATEQERRLFGLDGRDAGSKITAVLAPQAKRVALELERDGKVRVFLVDVASGKWRAITDPGWTDWASYSLQFSPDGRALLKAGRFAKQEVVLHLQEGQ